MGGCMWGCVCLVCERAAKGGYAPPVDDNELLKVFLCVSVCGCGCGCVVCMLPKKAMPPCE